MSSDPADGLTDELAAQIHSELDLTPEDDQRELVAARPGEQGRVELVLYGEDGEPPDVIAALTPDEARGLAAALTALADAGPVEP